VGYAEEGLYAPLLKLIYLKAKLLPSPYNLDLGNPDFYPDFPAGFNCGFF